MTQQHARVEFTDGAHATMWRMGNTLYDTYTSNHGYTTEVTANRIHTRERSKSLRELAEDMWENAVSITVR